MRYVVISVLQTAGVILLAVSGVLIGRWFGRIKSRAWVAAYVAPLLVIAAIGIPRWSLRTELAPPFKWIMSGRTEFVLIAVACTMLLTTPLSRLPQRRSRHAVVLLMILITGYFSVLPFLLPAFEYSRLAELETKLDQDGVCLQSTDYDCGPAAAVTVLRRLGVPAEEGRLALRAHTTRFTGTPTDSLCNAIRHDYDVPCRIVYCDEVSELQGKEPFVAVVRYNVLIDHYVAVLSVSESAITIGDPAKGLRTCTPEEFDKKWRGCAIVVGRESSRLPAQSAGLPQNQPE